MLTGGSSSGLYLLSYRPVERTHPRVPAGPTASFRVALFKVTKVPRGTANDAVPPAGVTGCRLSLAGGPYFTGGGIFFTSPRSSSSLGGHPSGLPGIAGKLAIRARLCSASDSLVFQEPLAPPEVST